MCVVTGGHRDVTLAIKRRMSQRHQRRLRSSKCTQTTESGISSSGFNSASSSPRLQPRSSLGDSLGGGSISAISGINVSAVGVVSSSCQEEENLSYGGNDSEVFEEGTAMMPVVTATAVVMDGTTTSAAAANSSVLEEKLREAEQVRFIV